MTDVDDMIAEVHYFTAGEAVDALRDRSSLYPIDTGVMDLCTLAVVQLRNGHIVIGQATCAQADDYDETIERQMALIDAHRQIRAMLAYQRKEAGLTRDITTKEQP